MFLCLEFPIQIAIDLIMVTKVDENIKIVLGILGLDHLPDKVCNKVLHVYSYSNSIFANVKALSNSKVGKRLKSWKRL